MGKAVCSVMLIAMSALSLKTARREILPHARKRVGRSHHVNPDRSRAKRTAPRNFASGHLVYIMNNPLSGRDPSGYAPIIDRYPPRDPSCALKWCEQERAFSLSGTGNGGSKDNGNESSAVNNKDSDASVATNFSNQSGVNNPQVPMGRFSGTQSVGEMIDSGAQRCGPVACAGWATLSASWTLLGAEGVSQISAHGLENASAGDRVGAGFEVLAAVPLVGQILKAGKPVAQGVKALAGGAIRELSTAAHEAVFWSGLGRGGADSAAAWAAKNGGITLESVMAAKGITLPVWDASNPAIVAAWRQASIEFAAGARGNVRVLQGDFLRSDSIWKTEFSTLKANPDVTSIRSVSGSTGEEVLLWER